MKKIIIELSEIEKKRIKIGYEGEQNHTQVIIRCGAFFAKYPDATAYMTVQTQTNLIYPVELEKDGSDLIWDVSPSDVSIVGTGKLQLTFTDGSGDGAEIIKSAHGSYDVLDSLDPNGDAPDPIKHWIDQAEQTARQIAEESAIYAKEEIVESYGSIAPAIIETASGEIASISDGADGMLVKKLEVAIDPVQDLHGYDSPWPAGGGKNLCEFGDQTFTQEKVVTLAKDIPAGTYMLSALVTSESTSGACNVVFLDTSNNTISRYIMPNTGSRTAIGSAVEATNPIHQIILRSAGNYSQSAGISATYKDIQIESGSTATAWSPYENVCPISGWTGANVSRTGKNLLNLVESEMITIGWNRAFPISIKEGTYIISCQNQFGISSAFGARVSLTDENNVVIKYLTSNYSFGNTEYSGSSIAITEEEASRIKRINFGLRAGNTPYADIAKGNLQLELGSTASSYAEYHGSTAEYEFPEAAGTVYGGSLTIHQDGSGELVADHADVDLGTLNYTKANQYFYADAPSDSAPVIGNGQPFICEIYKRYVGALNSMPDFTAGLNNVAFSGIKVFYCKDSRFDNASDFKTAMSGVKLVYPLATPVTYQLTNQQVLELLKGQNNVWADTGDVALEYPADTKLYIDGKVAELQALILENISNS